MAILEMLGVQHDCVGYFCTACGASFNSAQAYQLIKSINQGLETFCPNPECGERFTGTKTTLSDFGGSDF